MRRSVIYMDLRMPSCCSGCFAAYTFSSLLSFARSGRGRQRTDPCFLLYSISHFPYIPQYFLCFCLFRLFNIIQKRAAVRFFTEPHGCLLFAAFLPDLFMLFLYYFTSAIFLRTGASVLATVDISLMKISSATPTTSLRVSPIVSPVTAALCASEPLP